MLRFRLTCDATASTQPPQDEYILPEHYGPLYEWEHITTIKRGEALNNPFTGEGPGVVNTTIESMT
eukprot:5098006-Pleurochrysis_carterae.AAC.1